MRTATVGEVQKNFSQILQAINAGDEITITRHGKPVALLKALGPSRDIRWPDFYGEAVEVNGKSIGDVVREGREERFR